MHFRFAVPLVFAMAATVSVDARAQLSAQKLEEKVNDHIDETKYGAQGGVTQCSKFVRDVVNACVGKDSVLDGQVKDQVAALAKSTQWEELPYAADKEGTFEKARKLANEGRVVLVAYVLAAGATPTNTGHIAIVVPHDALEASGEWKMKVPMIAQAGKKNPRRMTAEAEKSVFAELKLSWGFGASTKDSLRVFLRKE